MCPANDSQISRHDDGVIKFKAHWQQSPPDDNFSLTELIQYRQKCHALGLIGVYDDGVAFGNISQRIEHSSQFYISGSATGALEQAHAADFCRVDRVAIANNQLWCSGSVIASSESMSHAALYQMDNTVNAVIHGHHSELWRQMLNQVPTTPVDIAYGTPAMAQAITNLFAGKSLADAGIFVMAGHEDGIFAFAADLPTAFNYLHEALKSLPAA